MNWPARITLLVAISAAVVLSSLGHAEQTDSTGPSGSLTPIVNFVTVKGDERKFREDWWMKDRWSGGMDGFTLEQDLGEHATMRAEGRGLFDADDYRVRLELVRYGMGFIRSGYTQYRSYDDDWGGSYRPFDPSAFRLDRDLHLDQGDVFVDLGLRLPDLPELTLGYERQTRQGAKSLLEWGGVQQGGAERKIFPSFKQIDERVDIFKADVVRIHQRSRYDLLSNVFQMDSHVNKKAYWSAAYMYNRMNGNAELNLDSTPFATVSPSLDSVKNWFTHSVDLDQDSHVVTANSMLDLSKEFAVYGGAQAERTRGTGNTDADLLELFGSFTNSTQTLIRSDQDKKSLEETLGIRFTGIPHTTLYADGKWKEEQYTLSEVETDDSFTNIFRNTETDVFRQQYTVGFNTAPFRRVTWSARYRRIAEANTYENAADISPGYPGFITEQDFTTDQVVTRLTVRPHAKLTLGFQYKLARTDIRTANKAIVFSGSTLVPASSIQSGEYDANTYTFNATLTPLPQLYLTGAFTLQDTRTIGFANNVPSVLAYRGNVYTAFGAVGYALDPKTDVTVDYTFSRSQNFQNNSAQGLPLGLDNERQALTVGLSRRISQNVQARLRYGYFKYEDRSNGGVNNYLARLASASCTFRF
jgi:hypothetical protein